MEKSKSATTGQVTVPATSIVLLHNAYKQVNVDTVIMLLLRCKKLYQAMYEIKKVIETILKQEEAFAPAGPLDTVVSTFESFPARKLSEKDEQMLVKGLQILRQASRKVASFLNDHRIFKKFIWNGADHHQTLLAHATRIQKLLV